MTPEQLAMLADDIYEVTIGHRRYFALRFQGEEITVRVPLDVFTSGNPVLLGEYAETLLRKIMTLSRSKAAVTKASLTLPL
jgi:hypothetical protein